MIGGSSLQNERGSALLLVLFAVVFVGVLFGGLYVVVQSSHQQAITHKLQVQAEYDAQKMMDLALHYYYDDRERFDEQFAGETEESPCLQDGDDEVCLDVTEEDGQRIETLRATGRTSLGNEDLAQSITIQFTLGEDGSEAPNPQDPYLGSVCGQDGHFLRALNIGADFDLTRALPEAKRSTITDDPDSVSIIGGVHLDNDGEIRVPGDPQDEILPVSVNLSGYLSPQGGLVWADHPETMLEYRLLGDYAREGNSCAPNEEWHHYLTDLATTVSDEQQEVDVYKFIGNYVLSTSAGSKKAKNTDEFLPASDTLADVLTDTSPKIVLIEGSVILEQEIDTNGWLIVYDPDPDAPANIYLPDAFVWTHHGAITADRLGRYRTEQGVRKITFEWPFDYRLSISLTRGQAKLYQQD